MEEEVEVEELRPGALTSGVDLPPGEEDRDPTGSVRTPPAVGHQSTDEGRGGVEGDREAHDKEADGGDYDVPNLSQTWPFIRCRIVLSLNDDEGDHGGHPNPKPSPEGWRRVGGRYVFYDSVTLGEQKELRRELRRAQKTQVEEGSPVLRWNRTEFTSPPSDLGRILPSSRRKSIKRFQLTSVNNDQGQNVTAGADTSTLTNRRGRIQKITKSKHSKSKTVWCTVTNCNRPFTSRLRLKTHMKLHDERRTFRCSQCSCSFWKTASLRSHEGRFHKDPDSSSSGVQCQPATMHKCLQCPFLTEVEQDWQVHMARHRREQRRFKCSYSPKCGRYFGKLEELREHVDKLHGKDRAVIIPHQPTVCGDGDIDNSKEVRVCSLASGKEPIKGGGVGVTDEVKLVIEDICEGWANKPTTIQYASLKLARCDDLLKQYELLPDGSRENGTGRIEIKTEENCVEPESDVEVKTEDNCIEPQDNVEVNSVNSSPPTGPSQHLSQQGSSNSSEMLEVLPITVDVEGESSAVKSYACKKPFRCPHCSTHFMRRSSLTHHVNKDHPDGEVHHCLIPPCTKSFCQEEDLWEHHCLSHSVRGRRNFRCQYCDLGFPSRQGLRIHERIHTVKPHKCPKCDKGFQATYDLGMHLFKCQKQLLERTAEN